MYKLKEITDKNIWNNFIEKNNFEFYSFLCSWQWFQLQKALDKEIFMFGIFEGNTQIGILPLIKNSAKRGIYLFAPHTPLIISEKNFFTVLENILEDLKIFAKKQKASFIRFNSPVKNLKENKNFFKKLGFIDAPMHEHAEDTHLLDLKKSEEELFLNIKKKDRYYINRAKKQGVEIIKGNTEEQIKNLIKMHENHSKKINYHAFSEDFIRKLYKFFGKNITTISAKYNGEIESILMTIRFHRTCVYYIAASDIKNPKFSPNYLCQWEAILQAKTDGAEIYNFWGVAPDDNPAHPIAGVSKFKRKFAGCDYSLLHAQDLIISWKYCFNRIVETIRRKKRGYYYKKIK